VLELLAPQLGLLPMLLAGYPRDEKTRFSHLERIRRHLGFVRCDRVPRQHLLDHLTSVARGAPRTESLRRAAHAWLAAWDDRDGRGKDPQSVSYRYSCLRLSREWYRPFAQWPVDG
jgi:hypothetical protein